MFRGGQEAGAQDIVRKVADDEDGQVELNPLLCTLVKCGPTVGSHPGL